MAISLSALSPVALQLLDLLADGAGFLLAIPRAGDGDFLAQDVVGAQRLAEPALVMGDDVRGGGEDMAGRAVIALEPDHRGAGEIVLEAQNVVDLGAAPAVDRLVVVADAADVFGGGCRLGAGSPLPARGERVWGEGASPLAQAAEAPPHPRFARPLPARGERWCCRPLRQQPQPQILRDIGVLIFVDQNEFEARLILAQHFGLLAEQPDAFEQADRRNRRR